MTTPHDRPPVPGDTTSPASLARTRVEDDDDYSATMLASHWIQRPDDDGPTVLDTSAAPAPSAGAGTTVAHTPAPSVPVAGAGATMPYAPDSPAPAGGPSGTVPYALGAGGTVPRTPGSPAPQGRVDGTVLRFGPGVTTAALSHGAHTALATVPPPARRHRRMRRHTLPALVLVAAVVFLFWRGHSEPGLAVRDVSVTTAEAGPACDATADVVGMVRTDGNAGEFSYRWVRNDGTSSDVLHASVADGRHETRVHLLWTFEGRGHHDAEAELRVLSPSRHTATVRFSYDCP